MIKELSIGVKKGDKFYNRGMWTEAITISFITWWCMRAQLTYISTLIQLLAGWDCYCLTDYFLNDETSLIHGECSTIGSSWQAVTYRAPLIYICFITNNSTLGTNEIEKMNAFRGGRRERDFGRISAGINY